jgi:signal peptidase I
MKIGGRPALAAVFLLLAAAWFFLAPPQLGGSTLYSATVGTSMAPRFHAGDLAVVRRASSYKVGQVVLYESPVFHRAVLHRIVVVQDGHYFFQGDNNDFVDAGYATRSELLGRLWFRVPRAGRILTWIGTASHSALIAGAGTLLLLLVGGRAASLRPRRRRRRSHAAGRSGRRSPVVTSPIVQRLRRPRRSLISLLGLVALLIGATAFGTGVVRPARRVVQMPSYESTGSFSYSGRANTSSTAYPTGVVRTGAPIFLAAVRHLDLSFAYAFRSRLPHDVRGTILLRGLLTDQNSTWRHLYRLGDPKSFVGDRSGVHAQVDLRDLTKTLANLESSTGTPGASYAVQLAPVVHISGTIAGKRVSETFAPTLPFTVSPAVLKLDVSAPATPPGATFATPSAASLLASALNPSQEGTLPKRVPNTLTLGGSRFTDAALEIAGALLVLAGGWALVGGQVRRRRDVWSPERRVAHRYGCDLFDVSDLPQPSGTAVTPVPDLETLAGIARQAERPILRHSARDSTVFVVDDPPRLYRFESALRPEPLAPTPTARPRRRLPAVPRRATGVAVLVIAIALTVAVSAATFTSGNLVPASYAGRSTVSRTIAQLLPPLCASTGATNLIVATSSSTSGTSLNDLILGRNATGSQTLNGSSGDDCLVAGGGAGTVNSLQGSGGTDVCIGARGAVNNYSGCETTGTS